jgi:hypothetical protein
MAPQRPLQWLLEREQVLATRKCRKAGVFLYTILVVHVLGSFFMSDALADYCIQCVCCDGAVRTTVNYSQSTADCDEFQTRNQAFLCVLDSVCENYSCPGTTTGLAECYSSQDHGDQCIERSCSGGALMYRCDSTTCGLPDPCVAPAPAPVPTMTEWGLILFMAAAGLAAVWFLLRRRRTVA